jgi:hypothetical protein
MTFTPKRFQSPPPPITAADVPLSTLRERMAADVRATVARQRAQSADESAAKLQWLLAHPAPGRPASAGELAEQRHLLYDADPDSTVPAFPYPTPLEA